MKAEFGDQDQGCFQLKDDVVHVGLICDHSYSVHTAASKNNRLQMNISHVVYSDFGILKIISCPLGIKDNQGFRSCIEPFIFSSLSDVNGVCVCVPLMNGTWSIYNMSTVCKLRFIGILLLL